MIVDFVGWACTATLILSYAFKGNKLRIVNSIASILYIVYGLMLKQLPIVVTNVICLIIHIYYIFNFDVFSRRLYEKIFKSR